MGGVHWEEKGEEINKRGFEKSENGEEWREGMERRKEGMIWGCVNMPPPPGWVDYGLSWVKSRPGGYFSVFEVLDTGQSTYT